MESRVNRYYKRKLERKNKKIKIFLLFSIFLILFGGLNIVNDCYNFLTEVENKVIFNYNYTNGFHDIELMGEKYNISQIKINKQINEVITKIKDKVTHIIDDMNVLLNN
ncbi:MAG: hypothetical protein FH753_08475 [Firmicutes bacterium]|nr:hypothetical protein [Bacillota bacterium]